MRRISQSRDLRWADLCMDKTTTKRTGSQEMREGLPRVVYLHSDDLEGKAGEYHRMDRAEE